MAQTSHTNSNVSINGNLTVSGTTTLNPDDIATSSLALAGALTVGTTADVTGALTAASSVVTGASQGATVVGTTSVKVGSTGTALTLVAKGTISVTVAADLAAAEEDVSLTIAAATVGDMVIVTPLNAAMETGVGIVGAWVSANGTVKVRISNFSGSTLTGSTANWQYCLIRS